jgi:hypothetical protein
VTVVLVKAFDPSRMARWRDMETPDPNGWRYPFWAHIHHAEHSAQLAAEAGCDPLAVTLIRYHAEVPAPNTLDPLARSLLLEVQAADDDN